VFHRERKRFQPDNPKEGRIDAGGISVAQKKGTIVDLLVPAPLPGRYLRACIRPSNRRNPIHRPQSSRIGPDPFAFHSDCETNNRGRFLAISPPFVTDSASVPRMMVSFNPDTKGYMMLITGDNEYFFSPHRTDMTDARPRGEYFCMEDEKAKYNTVMLPGGCWVSATHGLFHLRGDRDVMAARGDLKRVVFG
jgi:Penicillin amidase